MKAKRRYLLIPMLGTCFIISGCGPGQLFGSTLTPIPPSPISPTMTLTPTLTPTSTPMPTLTSAPTLTLTPTFALTLTCAQATSDSSIPVSISPFYYSQGVQVNVGKYSQQLRTRDSQELTALAQEMASQKEVLTPQQMFVLSIRLYDLGCKDSSVYWWYEARFRAILFKHSLDPAHVGGLGQPAFELPAAYGAFSQLAGSYLNGYAGCDIDKWINILKMVKDDNLKPPELDKIFPNVVFVDRSQWQQINDDIIAQFDGLINDISTNKDTIKQQRATNNADAQFCH